MKTSLILLLVFFYGSSIAQEKVKDLSSETLANYILANVYETNKLSFQEIYKGAFFLRIYKMTDSFATPKNFSEGTDEVASSILISVVPDGDYYTTSKLYKIETLVFPEIKEIKETTHPEFVVVIESGPKLKRTTQRYTLKAK